MHQNIRMAEEKTMPQKKSAVSVSEIFKENITRLEEVFCDLPESDRESIEHEIQRKLKLGIPLTDKELNYLRVHNPDLYRSVMRIECARKNLKAQLKKCRSKEEVQNVISGQLSVLKGMKNDPDREYMTAMIMREIDQFKKSAGYARLPEKTRDARRKKHCNKSNEYEEYDTKLIALKIQSYHQCKTLSEQLKKLA